MIAVSARTVTCPAGAWLVLPGPSLVVVLDVSLGWMSVLGGGLRLGVGVALHRCA